MIAKGSNDNSAHIGTNITDNGSYGSLSIGQNLAWGGMRSVCIGFNNNLPDHRNGIVSGAYNSTISQYIMSNGNVLGCNLKLNGNGANGLLLAGQYNAPLENTHQFVVGTGTSSTPKNGLVLDTSSNLTIGGKITVGTAPVNDMDVATKKYVDDNSGGSSYTAGDGININNDVISTIDNYVFPYASTN